MSEADLALAQIQELRDAIDELQIVRDAVSDFDVASYRDAGGGKWAGQQRDSFITDYDGAKNDFAQLRDGIYEAMIDCDSKRQSLLYSIDPAKDPIQYQQAMLAASPRVA